MSEAKRAPAAAEWGKLERHEYGGDFRHYLDGEPIHCGQSLVLQSLKWNDDGGNEWIDEGIQVRYEIEWNAEGKGPVLYTVVGGHDFVIKLEPDWMRFRWPPRRR